MKSLVFTLFIFIGFILHSNCQEPDFFKLTGYATIDGITTGGYGGDSDTAETGLELQTLLSAKKKSTTPLTIFVKGQINLANSTGLSKIDVKEVQDVTIIGLGDSADFYGIGLKIYKSSNIIIRNIKVHHVLSGDKDCIGIEGPADHIWIDHCELYNEYLGVDKDYYDGLLDAKSNAEYITYSWNYLHDSWKAMLVGSSESDTYDRKITMHHNLFENINSRLPLFRSSTGHFFNNYYKDVVSTAINSRINACAKIENNYFEHVNNPWVSAYSDILGGGDVSGNVLVNSTFSYSDDTHELPECSLSVPYDYSAFLHNGNDVPGFVTAFAGVGKLNSGINPVYYLNIETSGNGIVEINPEKAFYDSNEVVAITAVPEADWKFSGWSGDITNTTNPLVINISDNTSILANFTTNKKSLSYSSSGPGTITVDPEKVLYDSGSTVLLTATAYENAYFLKWAGDVESSENPLTLKTDSNISITGVFNYKSDSVLSIQVEDVYCELDGTVETEHSGYTGTGFVDLENITGSNLDFAIVANKKSSCTMKIRYAHGKTDERSVAIFINDTLQVTSLDFPPTGTWTEWDTVEATVNLSDGNNIISLRSLTESGSANIDKIDCITTDTSISKGVCNSDTMPYDRPTELKAVAVLLSEVKLNWIDNASGESSYLIQRKVDEGEFYDLTQTEENETEYSDKDVSLNKTYTYRVKAIGEAGESAWSNTVEVTLEIPVFTLTVVINPDYCGFVNVNPNQVSYDSGTVVTLTAKTTEECLFFGWSGDSSSVNDVVIITLDENKTIQANFSHKDNLTSVQSNHQTLKVIPNPVISSAEIRFTVNEASEVSINLINTVGIKTNIYQNIVQTGQSDHITIQTENYKPGLYILEMVTESQRTLTKMTIIN